MKTTLLKIIVISMLSASFTGCAAFGSDVRGLFDIKEAHTKVFDRGVPRCYELTAQFLKRWNAVIFQQSEGDYIVAMELETVFRSCINTTEVGIFFTAVAPQKTEVKVTSLNYNLSQFISDKLFDYIEKDGNVAVEEELKKAALVSTGNPFKKQ